MVLHYFVWGSALSLLLSVSYGGGTQPCHTGIPRLDPGPLRRCQRENPEWDQVRLCAPKNGRAIIAPSRPPSGSALGSLFSRRKPHRAISVAIRCSLKS
ncbi:hypothetical protein EDB83DRAFT_1885342 [Lactarius deliciosus]|nr:hypothetical protein EDB83DRAFT_1885342 [Lactarius deliciosus]